MVIKNVYSRTNTDINLMSVWYLGKLNKTELSVFLFKNHDVKKSIIRNIIESQNIMDKHNANYVELEIIKANEKEPESS